MRAYSITMANLGPQNGPALIEADVAAIETLHKKLKDPETDLPAKYRVLFGLRNVAGTGAHEALLTALKDKSALFRHDVAFCLGQRQDAAAVEELTRILHDTTEHPM